ncbi:hypothetical protein HYT55_00925 [Candidatus Woesearchaeota archaeon]|nr:hypothetical protein [Candidatus Woesearchaeota archaeon]
MAIVRARISCFRCQKSVDKTDTRFFDTVAGTRRYECFPCYQKSRNGYLPHTESKDKRELYCERCKYKFMSRVPVCPYCSKDDSVIKAQVTAYDLV